MLHLAGQGLAGQGPAGQGPTGQGPAGVRCPCSLQDRP